MVFCFIHSELKDVDIVLDTVYTLNYMYIQVTSYFYFFLLVALLLSSGGSCAGYICFYCFVYTRLLVYAADLLASPG